MFATEHGGIPEAIENGVSGVLVPERDDEALARALLNAAQDPGLLSRIGPVGAERSAKKFRPVHASAAAGRNLSLEMVRSERLISRAAPPLHLLRRLLSTYWRCHGCVTF